MLASSNSQLADKNLNSLPLAEMIPTHPKIQTEHKEDVIFIQKSLKDSIHATLKRKQTWKNEYSKEDLSEEILAQVAKEASKVNLWFFYAGMLG